MPPKEIKKLEIQMFRLVLKSKPPILISPRVISINPFNNELTKFMSKLKVLAIKLDSEGISCKLLNKSIKTKEKTI